MCSYIREPLFPNMTFLASNKSLIFSRNVIFVQKNVLFLKILKFVTYFLHHFRTETNKNFEHNSENRLGRKLS